MDLYLVQHGEAKPESEDSTRPLTERGRQDVEDVARAAARLGLRISVIRHSGKLRAKQTAEVFVAALRPPLGLQELAGVSPNDPPTMAAATVAEASEPWLLVGHLPHLSRLTSLLLVDDPERPLVAFRPGALIALTRGGGAWQLRSILTPEIARAAGGSA
jgi:phosphohistidine phosphatase